MGQPPSKALLSLLIALSNSKDELDASEWRLFKDIGQQLALSPEDWDSIQIEMSAVLDARPELQVLHQIAEAQLLSLDENSLSKISPTREELLQELPPDSHNPPKSFGYFKGTPELSSNEILSITVSVLTKGDPCENAKKLSFLKRLQALLQNVSS